ncbi:MAG: bifunctional phosphoribosylaminoimidazolecarboxamide formyltransferase/IMP cyclohydrolase, partial [Rhizobiales bacterium]|nr:bifunctional phosphoribosylaminoimidazolecarboxamide formyltransferase/IMP cyclohydrolase [Hyphomicrobiales bacterium]
MDRPIRRALLSVSDKTGLIDFARALAAQGVDLISTGGTAAALAAAGLQVTDVASITGFPEIMDGRVKTLHPKIHGGLLAVRGNAEHEKAQARHGIDGIDLLAVNLYPFEATVARQASFDEAIENIDVGGPAMIRAAAKNHDSVTVIVEASDYAAVLAEMAAHGGATTLATRRRLAAKAFGRTAAYDAAISQWFGRSLGEALPDYFAIGGRKLQTLRYGENPHQQAALYSSPDTRSGVTTARQVQGKELSYNNLNDTDAALECLAEFGTAAEAACVIVKHANPCGVAIDSIPLIAYRKALACDPVSAFGGIIALSRPLDAATAGEIVQLFTEVIVAPGADAEAIAIVAAKKNLRLLLIDALAAPDAPGLSVKTIAGGLLVQSRDNATVDRLRLRTVTKRPPTPRELADLRFAFRVAKHVKSNAIVYAKDGATVGIGAGQMNRRDSTRIAAAKAKEAAETHGFTEVRTVGS